MVHIYNRDAKSNQETVAGFVIEADFREREYEMLDGTKVRIEISKKALLSKYDNKLFGTL